MWIQLIVTILALIACLEATSNNKRQSNLWYVYIDTFEYNPSVLTIHAGDEVLWTNIATPPQFHSVVSDDGSFASDGFTVQGWFNWTFWDAGTYNYHDNYISQMRGRIIVLEAETTETVPTGWTEPEPEPETEETHWSEHTHSDHATDTATTSPLNSSSSGGTASTVVLSVVIAVILIVSMGAGFWVMKRKRLNTPEAQRLLS